MKKIYEVDRTEFRIFGESLTPYERKCETEFIHPTDKIFFKTKKNAEAYIKGKFEYTGEKIYLVSGVKTATVLEGQIIGLTLGKTMTPCKAYTDAGEAYTAVMNRIEEITETAKTGLQMTDEDVRQALKAPEPELIEGVYLLDKWEYVELKKDKKNIIINWLADVNKFYKDRDMPFTGFKQKEDGSWEMKLKPEDILILDDYIEVTHSRTRAGAPLTCKLKKVDDAIKRMEAAEV